MRKVALILLCVAVFAGIAAAQTYTQGTGLMGKDVLGAHNNYGRGCAGCHAPHNGGKGGGGNAATNAAVFNDPNSGTNALFGQDVTPLYGLTINTAGGSYVEALPSESAAYSTNTNELRSIMFCLACHDGLVARGGMMQGVSWEQANGYLPANVYGPNPIPTFLDNATVGYQAQHPVGTQATLGALRLVSVANNVTTNTSTLTVVVNNGSITSIAPNSAAYVQFAQNYGYPALAGSKWGYGVVMPAGDNNPGDAFLVCTTCHNQHSMYVYTEPGKQSTSPIYKGTFPTYFFINGPYNPGAAAGVNGGQAGSATQFCRQCHFSESNEAAGVNTVSTAF